MTPLTEGNIDDRTCRARGAIARHSTARAINQSARSADRELRIPIRRLDVRDRSTSWRGQRC